MKNVKITNFSTSIKLMLLMFKKSGTEVDYLDFKLYDN